MVEKQVVDGAPNRTRGTRRQRGAPGHWPQRLDYAYAWAVVALVEGNIQEVRVIRAGGEGAVQEVLEGSTQ